MAAATMLLMTMTPTPAVAQSPTSKNYVSGPMLAMDDLGRKLPTASESKTIAFDGKHYVGMFYFLWMGEHGTDGPYDITKIVEANPTAVNNANHSAWGPMNAFHFWGEPLYDYYFSSDVWVMRKHIEELTNANVDFLYIDVTNAYTYLSNAYWLMSTINDFLQQGWDAPKIVFYTNTNSAYVADQLYQYIYQRNIFPDTWFKINGKPVIVADPTSMSQEQKSYFEIRKPQWPNETAKNNAWPWMDFTRPQRVFYNASGTGEAISVSVAQHAGTIRFSDSAFYGNRTNRGRSWHNNTHGVTNDSYLNGYNFAEQWTRAISVNVPYVLVTGWNEWVAQRFTYANGVVTFVDCASTEYSRDIEMTKGKYFDNYYMQLISSIRKYKGAPETVKQNERKTIDLNGSFDQWDSVAVAYNDFMGDTMPRNAQGWGNRTLTNNTGRNDIALAKVAHDLQNLYFYVETTGTITTPDSASSWMQLFLDTDENNQGWYGYDYIANYQWKSAGKTTLAKATSLDNAYQFIVVADLDYKIQDNKMMIKVPLEQLGLANATTLKFEFKWGDSTSTLDTMEKMYTDGDTAPIGRLNFSFVADPPAGIDDSSLY
ncbi:hypothetical protein GX645_04145 [Candidatus Sumerlaeota bacterium]|nr:hypothetical protein [Candidatus Sumerlaeota bacterium]